MILLFRSGKLKILPPDISEAKFIAKYREYETKIVAVAFEAFNRLGSDIYTIIQAENIELSVEPFDITLTTCLVGDDEGPHDGNIMVREFHIGGVFDLYSFSTLVYQMLKNYDISSALCMTTGVVILKIVIRKGGKAYEMEASPDSMLNNEVMDWLKQFGIRCDTDEFLYKKSTRSKDDCVVTMRYSNTDGYVRPEYYWPQERQFLIITDESWKRVADEMDYAIVVKYNWGNSTAGLMYSGIAIPNTGLMYLCPISVGIELFKLESMEVYYSVYDQTDEIVYVSSDLISLNGYDCLYMALYLPQMLDANRFLYKKDPIKIDIEIISDKFMARRGRYDIATPRDDEHGIQMDMFGMLANVLINEPLSDIRREPKRTVDTSTLGRLAQSPSSKISGQEPRPN